MGGYQKVIDPNTSNYRFYESLGFPPVSGQEGTPLVIRITLGDMDLVDGFYMALPQEAAALSIEAALRKHVLCESPEERRRVREGLSSDLNPDLPDIYEALINLYEQERLGKAIINYSINNGASNISATDLVSMHQHLCTAADGRGFYRLLDLVLEVHDNIDPFARMLLDQKRKMLRSFRGIFILYMMDKFGYEINLHKISPKNNELASTLAYLRSEEGFVDVIEDEYFITTRGYDFLKSIVDEAEFYIDNYDIFGDVYLDRAKEVRFNTGYGSNLIIPVLHREGIDPYRALFIVGLYLGNLDHLADWQRQIFSEYLFKELFRLIVDSPIKQNIDQELLDQIIYRGKQKIEERRQADLRLREIEEIKRQMEKL